ncbi:MAG TPA: glycosyltransferase family 1 protein [Candidatus Angelobacter sp.]|nr:glycosyltransferase family 1 protein [Candidatus Angelobacter sp.]
MTLPVIALGNTKVRVGFDARWYNDSGVGSYVANLLRAMAAMPREIELIVYENPGNPVPALEGTAVRKVEVKARRYSLTEGFELRHRVHEDKVDLFHSPFYWMPRGLNCPVVVTMHDLIPFLFPIYPWPKQWVIQRGYRIAARQAASIIAGSENTAKDVREILGVAGERITPIADAADRNCFRPQGGCEELAFLRERYGVSPPYLVAASARNWRAKNLEGALQVLRLARRESNIGFQTVVYGPAAGLDAAGGEAAWPDLNLRRTGYMEAKDLAALFRHARAFVMPALYEGFGLPVLEAMSCGCAVITSNAGSLAEVAGEGAQVFAPHDVAGMARAISGLLRNREELDHWKAAALRRAEDFSWAKAARETISVYHRTREIFFRGRHALSRQE